MKRDHPPKKNEIRPLMFLLRRIESHLKNKNPEMLLMVEDSLL